jgi:hypothetical protein
MLRKFAIVTMSLALLATVAMAQNAPAAAAAPPTVGAVLDRQLSLLEKEMVPMGTDMPDSKFDFVPSGVGDFKGVRGFGDQLKHVAMVNYRIGGAILKEKPPLPADMASVKSKDQIMKLVQDSFAYAHKAFATITEKNLIEEIPAISGNGTTTRLWLATLLIGHDRDHYGQLVVYLRMNGIIPPASRH